MRIHYFQHEPFEGLAYIGDWALQNGHTVSVTRLFMKDTLPDMTSLSALVIMGGGMGAYEEDKYPWLRVEKNFISEAIKAGKKVLGICLGAQLIAAVSGAEVYPGNQKEIGWFPVYPAGGKNTVGWLYDIIKNKPIVFHWHGDTFSLPEGAVLHASNNAFKNQLFTIGENIMGIQFHFEATVAAVNIMISLGENELIPGPFVQSVSAIQSYSSTYAPAANQAMHRLLDNWFGTQNIEKK